MAMSFIASRTAARGSAGSRRKAFPPPAARWYRPCVEALEDRTLLSVGDGLNSVFGALQKALNGHFLSPSTSYSLPMVGQNLGNDPQAQFLAAIGSAVAGVTDPGQLKPAIPANSGTVTVTQPKGSQMDYAIQITNAQLTLSELFDSGLPGLSSGADPLSTLIGNLTTKAQVHVTVDLTYNLQLFFTLDNSGNVALDTTQNNATTPLLTLNVSAHFDSAAFQSLSEPLGPLTVDVTDNGSSFTAATQFNVVPNTYPAGSIDVTGSASSIFMPSAQASLDLGLTVDGAAELNFPGLETDLVVLWNLSNTTNAFDKITNDPQQPSMSFNLSVDLSSVGTWLNKMLLSQVAQKLQPLQPTLDTINNVLTTPIPIVGSVIPNGNTLEDLIENYTSAGKGAGTQIASFVNALEAIVKGNETLTQFTGSAITLASVDLPITPKADPRLATFDLAAVLNGLTPPSPSKQAQSLLSSLNLAGQFQLPLLANSLGDLQALLLDQNVVLVQWQLPSLALQVKTGIGPFPIVPPLAVDLGLDFGLAGGLTIGYDTYGLTTTTPTMLGWDQDPTKRSIKALDEGVFIEDARLTFSGSISLSAEADLGVAQFGGTGSFNLSFGIQGIHDSGQGAVDLSAPPPPPTLGDMSYPYHTVTLNGQVENVLQWGDIVYDALDGPLCPFQIGGELSIGLSLFVTLGFGPFSITYTYDLGNITIASFTINTCSGTSDPELAESDIKGADIGDLLQKHSLPALSAIDDQLTQEDTKFPGTQHWILLDLGDFAKLRNVQDNKNYPPDSESFEVMPDRNQTGLLVQAFGQQEDFANLNASTTTILVFGDPGGNIPVNLTVDQGVHANAYFQGGPVDNHVNYQGTGITYLKGGTSDNTLVGGAGINDLVGGDGTSTDPSSNVLVGGPGHNMLQGGMASATLTAGPQDDDALSGGPGTGTYILTAGAGDDELIGAPNGPTQFQWVEGDGNLQVFGGHTSSYTLSPNVLEVLGKKGSEAWTVSQDEDNRVIVATPTGKTIVGTSVVNLSIDSSDPNNDGGDTYTIDDLSRTGIQNVNLNLHEQANPDNKADQITVNSAATQDTVDVSWDEQQAGQQKGQTVNAPLTHVSITSTPPALGQSVTYTVTTAVPKPSDVLNVNTGQGDDTVVVESTQPDVQVTSPGGQVNVNTGGGADQITVGAAALDEFLGPLTVDAGAGHNDIRFSEGGSYVQDSVTLTASQVIRYSQPPTVEHNSENGDYTETAYPMVINYKATGGDFLYGVSFDTSYGGTNLAIPETGKNGVVLVNANGGYNGAHDAITVGYDAAWPTGQTQVIVDGQPLVPQFPTTAAGSTLAKLRSGIAVSDNSPTGATLDLDDETAPAHQSYTIKTKGNPALALLNRSGAADVAWTGSGLGVTLNAGNQDNVIDVEGTAQGTSLTVNTGRGNDGILVGDTNGLDDIGGLVTIKGGHGRNVLGISDASDGATETYVLSASQLHREANATAAAIDVRFFGMKRVYFIASNTLSSDWITVTGTPAGATVDVVAGRGDDLLRVDDLDNLQGPLNLGWQHGNKTVVIDDLSASANATYTLGGTTKKTTVTRTGAPAINLIGAVATLYLETGKRPDNIVNVASVPAGSEAVVFAGKGKTDVNVGLSQNLDVIQGTLGVLGDGPTRVILNDQKAGPGRTYALTASDVKFNASLPAFKFEQVSTLVLKEAPAAITNVHGTSQATNVQIQLGSGRNQVTVGSAAGLLAPINGPLTITGKTGNDPLVLDDQGDSSVITYTLGADSIATSESAPVQFANMASVTLNGGQGLSSYVVASVPGNVPTTINAQGAGSSLTGPNQANRWMITGPDSGTLDRRIAFSNIGNLIGGGHGNVFVFQKGASIADEVTAGAGTSTLDFSAYGKPVAAALNASGGQNGVIGSLSPAIGQGFFGIDTLIGDTGATLDGTGYTGDFDTSLTATGFAAFMLDVPGAFTGQLTAPSITSVFIGKRFAGQITTSGAFGSLSVPGDFNGSLVAASVASVSVGNFNGQIVVSQSIGTVNVSGTQASTAHVWLARAGAYTVINGALVGNAATNLAVIKGSAAGDATIQGDVTDVAQQTAGLVARYENATGSYYFAGITSVGTGYAVNIWRFQNGTLTPLTTAKKISGASATLNFQLAGSTLKLFVNDTLTITASDTNLTTGTSGVRGGAGTSFANFSVS
jgi:hypothetical protein